MFPDSRPRRLRRSESVRALVRETVLRPDDFIWPMFLVGGSGVRDEIRSMPGQYRYSVDRAVEAGRDAWAAGVRAVILFGIPEAKDEAATGAWSDDGIVQRGVRALKDALPDLVVVCDTCLCEYTSHGHCGPIVRTGPDAGHVDNDAALDILARTAVSQAAAGADWVAPSDMMDGRVRALRRALDGAGFSRVPVMAYAVKYASAFYGPFREAAESTPQFGDRRGYQMDPSNVREALREAALDVEEGADIVMVKPAMPYLDVVRAVRERFDVPVAAYHVSGEYAMLEAAARNGWIDRQRAILESLTCIRRAGADMVLTYYAPEAARWVG